MEKRTIRLLIIEDNKELCDILEDFFELAEDIVLCGICHDGEDALNQIVEQNPDVVVLDLIMPRLDGISFLEQLKTLSLKTQPSIIVTSAISQETITNRALSLGACYYMIKPYNLTDLHGKIQLVVKKEMPPYFVENNEKRMMNAITQLVIDIGVPTHIAGFKYVIESVKILTLHADKTCSIVKEVYATVADNNETTIDCVESAIRKTVARIFSNCNTALTQVLRLSPKKFEKAPSNAQLLTLLAEKIKFGLNEYNS